MPILEKLFKLRENNTTVGTEVRGGLATFLTMSYIIFVQPLILSATGLSWHTVFVATCVASAISIILMAFLANYPLALAPAMGHNILFLTYCLDGTINWQTGLGAVMISGTVFIIISLWGLRERIIHIIPDSLKHGIAVGIGLLIAFLGFQWAGIAVPGHGTLTTMGKLHSPVVLLSLGGLLLTAALVALRVRGAILIGIIVTALAGIPLGLTSTAQLKNGIFSIPRPAPMLSGTFIPIQNVASAPAGVIGAVTDRLGNALNAYYGKELIEPPSSAVMQTLTLPSQPPEAAPEQWAAIAANLHSSILVVPYLEKSGSNESLRVTTLIANGGKPTVRPYKPLVLPPISSDDFDRRLAQYSKDVALGLPGHNGFFQMDVLAALKLGLIQVVFVFFFLDLFDTIGTLVGVAQQAGFIVNGRIPRARGVLLADAIGTVVGASLGTSTVTSYIESSAGVSEGARTGLANLVTAALFLLALFFSPIVQMVGGSNNSLYPALAPVLIIIGSIMLRNVLHIQWSDPTEAIPAFLAIMLMPLTFSITEGIAFGFISYCFLKLVTGRAREAHWLLYLFAALFILRYTIVGT